MYLFPFPDPNTNILRFWCESDLSVWRQSLVWSPILPSQARSVAPALAIFCLLFAGNEPSRDLKIHN